MKLLTRFKLFGKKKIGKLMPVDNVTQLEELIKQQQKTLENSQQSYYNSKGKEDYYQKELESNEKLLKDTLKSAKKAKDDNDTEKLKKLFDIKNLAETRIKMYSECLEKQKNVSVKLNQFVTNLEKRVSKLKCDIDMLKTKEEFTKSVNEFKISQNGAEDININDVVKDIEVNFNASSYQFNDISVEDYSNEPDFKSFIEELK